MKNNTNADSQSVENKENFDFSENNCPIKNVFKVIGGKWKVPLINAISEECPKRFGELKRKMEDVTQTTLTLQLRELERDGIICRKVYAESPPRVEYKLSEHGIKLVPILKVLNEWWEDYCEHKTDLGKDDNHA